MALPRAHPTMRGHLGSSRPMSRDPSHGSDREPAHDVLAAEAFAVPTADPELRTREARASGGSEWYRGAARHPGCRGVRDAGGQTCGWRRERWAAAGDPAPGGRAGGGRWGALGPPAAPPPLAERASKQFRNAPSPTRDGFSFSLWGVDGLGGGRSLGAPPSSRLSANCFRDFVEVVAVDLDHEPRRRPRHKLQLEGIRALRITQPRIEYGAAELLSDLRRALRAAAA